MCMVDNVGHIKTSGYGCCRLTSKLEDVLVIVVIKDTSAHPTAQKELQCSGHKLLKLTFRYNTVVGLRPATSTNTQHVIECDE